MRPRPKKPVTTPATRTPRVTVHTKVTCRITVPGARKAFNGEVLNLSLGGMSAFTDQQLPPDTECEVTLMFGGDPADVQVKGWVAYTNERGLAVQFDALTPAAHRAIERITARIVGTA